MNETTFSPGDSVLFKRGQVWFNTLRISAQGAKEQPIFFDASGGGKPRFARDRQINGIVVHEGARTNGSRLVGDSIVFRNNYS